MAKLHAGLDVADKTTAICIIDEQGTVVLEAVADTTPAAIAAVLRPFRRSLKSIGQEAGGKSSWLHKGLQEAKFPIHSLDARHAHAALKARLNKTDANDALGLATLVARGIYTPAYIKTDEAIRIRLILSMREALLRKVVDLKGAVRMAHKLLGQEAPVQKRKRKPVENDDRASAAISSVLRVAEVADLEVKALSEVLRALVDESPLCQRLMGIPGVGAITALTFVAAIDDPHRFKSSRDVGPYFGMSPRTFQSGGISRSGGISHHGDRAARKALFIAARVMLTHSHSTCSLRLWGLKLAKAKGLKIASVAVGRKLAVLMHHLWMTGEDFDPAR